MRCVCNFLALVGLALNVVQASAGFVRVDSSDKYLTFARSINNYEIVKLFLENGADIHAFRFAAKKGHFGITTLLIQHGANIHVVSDGAFRNAAEMRFAAERTIVKLLISSFRRANPFKLKTI